MERNGLDARLGEVESQMAHAQKTIEDLNEVVCRLEPELRRMQEELELLSHEILRLTEGMAEPHIKSGGQAD